jgi:hypothetical protein
MKRGLFIAWAAAVLFVGGVLFSRWQAENESLRQRISTLERENRELQARLSAALTPPAPAASGQPAPAPAAAIESRAAAPAPASPEVEHRLRQLREELAQAAAKTAQLEEKIQQSAAQLGDLELEKKRLAGSERELNEDLSHANRLVNALQSELKAKNERLVQVEVANVKLKEQNGADAQRLRQLTALTQELQEVHRRREIHLANVLRRYKEVTDQYRALAGTQENRPGPDTPVVNTAELARIQNAISMAEDDLRQLNSLNAQALRIQRQLTAK